ncbi:helix-turn-helix domain-containing protein [Embleya sp. NPDC059237]|uniref:helix-turn-helix domain-containing protein n=1 Tax=Embleya sp. NPDC059237 TaxID=3346784 RepID=UPI0036969610
MSTRDWKHLGRELQAARIAAGFNTLEDLARAVNLSSRILGDIEAGRRESYRPSTLHRVERAVGWTTGSYESVLAGGSPRLAEDGPGEQGSRPTDATPVGYGIDPDVLVELATATPEQIQRVKDFLLGIKYGDPGRRRA